jgi:glycine dehydrogenase subunit 1
MQRVRYAMKGIAALPGVAVCFEKTPHFKEFVVSFEGAGKTVGQVNAGLLERGIFGGKDLSDEFPSLGQSALYCVTEVHTQADLDQLVTALREVIR